MTVQINDMFRYRDVEYAVAGISEGELFDVYVLGLKPEYVTTACWRGYQAFFSVVKSRLILDALHVNLFQEGEGYEQKEGPVINGIMPSPSKEAYSSFNNFYEGLNYHIEYSGGLLIADSFINDLYVHMGFHPAWKYKNVIELIFEKGALKAELNRSKRMEKIRKTVVKYKSKEESGQKPNRDEIARFVEQAFDRTYNI